MSKVKVDLLLQNLSSTERKNKTKERRCQDSLPDIPTKLYEIFCNFIIYYMFQNLFIILSKKKEVREKSKGLITVK